ncbi:MAG TPA: hypothetical protein DEA47_02460 [Peptococcaceae bacterium]|nr:MAG: hypothetical protein XD50_0067 [Clostridia bacterium 41_269]HBT20223.1 hypothetical protein [Peptococcaceae bacterium]
MFLSKSKKGGNKNEAPSKEKIFQLMQLNRYHKALDLLEKLIPSAEKEMGSSSHELLKLYKYYGECLIHTGQFNRAFEVLQKGLNIVSESNNPCKEVLEETAIPALEKEIIQNSSNEKAYKILKTVEDKCPPKLFKQILLAYIFRAFSYYKLKDFKKAAEAYSFIIPVAEKYGCLDYDSLIRAGDSCLRCGNLNRAWKYYEMAKPFSNTYQRQCRLHKKIADLLTLKNQNWHAILHFLAALQSVPSDQGAKTKLKKMLKKLGLEKYADEFLQLNTKYTDLEQLEASLLLLKKQLKAG